MPAILLEPIAPATGNNAATFKMNMHVRDTWSTQIKDEMESMVCNVCMHCTIPHLKHPELL
ncbi:hypothetical protein HDU98_009359 [Podochytrium sp. JEL0797]|nr:hypothetical protein HDU98_009359 [Podochytrium sp. JEL0797]